MPTKINNTNVAKMIVGSTEALYARKGEDVAWRRDRVVCFKTNVENSIESVTFRYNTNSEHVSSDTNYNNGSIDGNEWTDNEIMNNSDFYKSAFYEYGNTNIRVIITFKDGYYYDRTSLDSEYFDESMCSNPVYITTASGEVTQFKTVEFVLKANKSIDNDVLTEIRAVKYTSVQISFPNFSGLYVNGTITSGNNTLKTYNYQFVDQDRANTLISLNFDQQVKVNLDIYSSLKGINSNLNTAIANTTLGTEEAGGGIEYTELFGYIDHYGFDKSEGVSVINDTITCAELSDNNAYFISNGYKAVHISSDTDEWVIINAIIGASNLYVCKLENNLNWCSDYTTVCTYEITDGTHSPTISQDFANANRTINIYSDKKLDGYGTNYLRVRVDDFDDSGMPNVVAGNITTDAYIYTNTINGTSHSSSDGKYLMDYTELGESKIEMYLATFEDYKPCSISIERITFTIDFVLDKNGYNVDEDYFGWTKSQIIAQYHDKVILAFPNQTEFCSSTDDDTSNNIATHINRWYDVSGTREDSIFEIPGYNNADSSLGQFERTSDFSEGELIENDGTITMKTTDYIRAKLTTVKYTYSKISEIRIGDFGTNPLFPTSNTVTRFERIVGTRMDSEDTYVTYMSDLNSSDNVYLWIRSSSYTFDDNVTRWIYFSNEFFSNNNLYNNSQGGFYVNGLISSVIPCIITRSGSKELWFLTTISGGGHHTKRNITEPKITDSDGTKYNPLDLYININHLRLGSYQIDDDTYYELSIGDNSQGAFTGIVDMYYLGESSQYNGNLLYASNVYWSCSADTATYSISTETSKYQYKYIDESGTEVSGKEIAYYLRLPTTLNNDNYGRGRFQYMFNEWNNTMSSKKLSRSGLQPGHSGNTITISFAVVLPKYRPSDQAYNPYGEFLANKFTKVIVGDIYNKTYGSQGKNEAYLFMVDPSGYNNSWVLGCKMNETGADSHPKYQQSNALKYTIAPPWIFTVN